MKLKIDNDLLTEDFFEDTQLLGIVSPIKDYHFCWHLNQLLHYDFRNNNNIEIQLTKKNRKYFFAVYEFKIPNSALVHYIYNNQFDGEYLLPEFKHLDFLWLIKGQLISAIELQNITNNIKKINQVQLVTILTNEKIKNKEHLIL
jgi:hypothetical protein